MRPYRYAVLAVAMGLVLPSAALACLWDHDTIKTERARFPSALELITGKFLRHSPEFYRWRIENRLKRLETDPSNVALLDDLAVAYDKTGQHDKAIETAQRTEKLRPGRYETAANLGTFYFHAGKLEAGLPHIDRALRINPDAHFGRERYQKLLVEYALERRNGGSLKLPLNDVEVPAEGFFTSGGQQLMQKVSFAEYLRSQESDRQAFDRAAAIRGVLGMMKFGKHDAPVLLEALGTLLLDESNPEQDAKQLAARAFLKASYEVPDGPARVAYREMAAHALALHVGRDETQAPNKLEAVETDFKRELEEGRVWYAELRERELAWIRDGKDPEAEFDKLYGTEPEVSGMDVQDPVSPKERLRWALIAGVATAALGFVVTAASAALLVRWYYRRRAAHS